MSQSQVSSTTDDFKWLCRIQKIVDVYDSYEEKDIEEMAKDIFFQACHCGNKVIVEMLLDHGVPIDTPFANGMTGLAWASNNGHVSIVKLLLDRGADKKKVDDKGRTPLDHAISQEKNHHDMYEYDNDKYDGLDYDECQSQISTYDQIIELLE